jgi:O-antigen/teichoic acid export membrane protein
MSLKSLIHQTAIYGVSSILVRLINSVLTPLYSLWILKKEIGVQADFMAMVAVLNVIYMLGMETSFFRFNRDYEKKEVYTTSQSFVSINSFIWTLIFVLLASPICNYLKYPGKEIYIYFIAATLFLENMCNIPFANLRYENKATQFVSLKVVNIIICMILNIIFLKFIYVQNPSGMALKNDAVVWIFIANFVPWFLTFLYFSREILAHFSIKKRELWSEMIRYSLPMTIVGMAGMVNETMDRVMLKNLLPYSLEKNLEQMAIYNVNYKLAIVITLVIQAFRMGAEPFFFKISKDKDATKTYAIVMDFFIIACTVIMVLTSLNRNLLASINEGSFIEGVKILPIILLANLFLGIYYNLSVWFKLSNNTHYGAIISCIGAAITLAINWYFIPTIGYIGSAFGHLACYFIMTTLSLYWGQKKYPIPYNVMYNITWIALSLMYSTVVFYLFSENKYDLIGASIGYIFTSFYFAYRRFVYIKPLIT